MENGKVGCSFCSKVALAYHVFGGGLGTSMIDATTKKNVLLKGLSNSATQYRLSIDALARLCNVPTEVQPLGEPLPMTRFLKAL